MKLTMLPAGEGDALWLQWGPAEDRRQLLVDLGVRATGEAFRARMAALPLHRRKFELLVITHVDTDHIFGILSALVDAEPLEGFEFSDIWFNGFTHLDGGKVSAAAGAGGHDPEHFDVLGASAVESYGGVQGEQFSRWMRHRPWNRAFAGGPVLGGGSTMHSCELAHGLRVTVLGPKPARLRSLAPKWRSEVKAALEKGVLEPEGAPAAAAPGLEAYGRHTKKPELASEEDLEFLADTDTEPDESLPNGSSISLLVEWQGKRLILAGDAFADDLVEAIRAIGGEKPLSVDAFKLPHHGSQRNVSAELVRSVSCQKWLISTNGVKHNHPDPIAVARVIKYANPRTPVLWFNEPSEYNGWWNCNEWKKAFGYETRTGTKSHGIEIEV